jgi:hypothetical protein
MKRFLLSILLMALLYHPVYLDILTGKIEDYSMKAFFTANGARNYGNTQRTDNQTVLVIPLEITLK